MTATSTKSMGVLFLTGVNIVSDEDGDIWVRLEGTECWRSVNLDGDSDYSDVHTDQLVQYGAITPMLPGPPVVVSR